MTVLVCGATGSTGGEVLRQLRAVGVPVRAMTRSEASADRLRGEGIDVAVADLADPGSLAGALEGADPVFVATTVSPVLPTLEGNLARAAAQAGGRHLVKVSALGAGPDAPIAFSRAHTESEEAIKDAGVTWTMLRCNGFMQNTLAWAGQLGGGAVYGPVMDARWSIVDARDVAAVAVAVLRSPSEHAGAVYNVTGPEASSPREQIATLAEILGRPIEAHEIPIEAAKEFLRSVGMDAWTVEALGDLFALYAEAFAEAVSTDVERATGHAPHSYSQFAQDHQALFETPAATAAP
jgi:uncharacterized protein YbjT (DUF2867 family)